MWAAPVTMPDLRWRRSWRGKRAGWRCRSGLGIHEPGARIRGRQLFDHDVQHVVRRAGTLLDRSPAPALEIGVHLGRAVLHREGVDRGLEVVGQHALDLCLAFPRHDLGRDVLPEEDLVLRHHASTSSANRSSSSVSYTHLTLPTIYSV